MLLQPEVSPISRATSAITIPDIKYPEEPANETNTLDNPPPAQNADSYDSSPESEVAEAPQAQLVQKPKRRRRRRGGFGSSKPPVRPNPDDYEQKYPEDDHGYEMGPNARVWRTYLDEAETFDTNMVEAWKDDIDVLLTFAGLFSAVVTTFVAQTSQKFEVDQTEVVISLLSEVVGLQRALANAIPVDTVLPSALAASLIPSATSYDVWTNALWFTSLSFSLATALGAVLAKQWLQHYSSTASGTQQQRVRIRQFRYIGLRKWGVPVIIAVLPILLHIAVFLFFTGLAVFLFPLNRHIAYVVGSIGVIVYVGYILSVIIAAISLQCPYKTPLTLALHRLFTFVADGIRVIGHITRAVFCWSRWGSSIWVGHLAKRWSRSRTFTLGVLSLKTLKPTWLQHFSQQWSKWRTGHSKRWPLDAEIRFVGAKGDVLEAEAMRWLLTSSANPTVHAIIAKALPLGGFGGIKDLHVQPEDTDIGRLLENSQVRSRLLVAVAGIEVVGNAERWTANTAWKRDPQVAERLFQACHHINLNWKNNVAPIFSTIFNPHRDVRREVGDIRDLSYADSARVDTILSAFPARTVITNYLTTCANRDTQFAPVVWTGLFEILSAVYFAHARRDLLNADHVSLEADNFAQRWKALMPFLRLVPYHMQPANHPAEHQDSHMRVHNQLLPTPLRNIQITHDHDICYAIMTSALLIFSLPEDTGRKQGMALQLMKWPVGLQLDSSDFHTSYGIIGVVVWLNCLCKLHELPEQALTLAATHLLHWSLYSKDLPWATTVRQELIQPIVQELVSSTDFLTQKWTPEAGGMAFALYFYLFQEKSGERKRLVERLYTNSPRHHLIPALLYSVTVITPPEDHYSVAWSERTVHFPNIEEQHMLKPVSEILCEWSPLQAAQHGFGNPMLDTGPFLSSLIQQNVLSAIRSHSSHSTLFMKGRLGERAWERWVADGHAADWQAPSRRLMSAILQLVLMATDEFFPLEPEHRTMIIGHFYGEDKIALICNILIATSFVSRSWLAGSHVYNVTRFDYDPADLENIKRFRAAFPADAAWTTWVQELAKNLVNYYTHVLEGRHLRHSSDEWQRYNMLTEFVKEMSSSLGQAPALLPSYGTPATTPIREMFRHSFHSPHSPVPVSPA